LANSYLQELSKINWIKTDLIEMAQNNNFVFDQTVKLDGEQATKFARSSCATSWTENDRIQAADWTQVIVRLSEFGQPGNQLQLSLSHRNDL